MDFISIIRAVILVSGALMIILVLLQQRGASLGAGFGGSGELYTTRRGLEKSIFNVTIVFAIVFVLSILTLLLIPE
jgi:preprotein translocase subunit SecG